MWVYVMVHNNGIKKRFVLDGIKMGQESCSDAWARGRRHQGDKHGDDQSYDKWIG